MARVAYKGFDLPDGSEIPDVPADLRKLVDSGAIPRFANAAARDLALPTPVIGTVVYVTDVAELQIATTTASSGWRRAWRNLYPLQYAQVNVGSGSVAQTPLAVPGLAVTLVLTKSVNSQFRVQAGVCLGQQTGNSIARAFIYQGANLIAGGLMTLNQGAFGFLTLSRVWDRPAGSYTFQVYISTDAGTVYNHNDLNITSWITAEEVN